MASQAEVSSLLLLILKINHARNMTRTISTLRSEVDPSPLYIIGKKKEKKQTTSKRTNNKNR